MDSESDSESLEIERIELLPEDYPHLKLLSNIPKTINLNPQRCYRYILPSEDRQGLNAFYGDDCSFCIGQMFDASDFLVEFRIVKVTTTFEIPHHKLSYRGRLRPSNVEITAIYYSNPPIDFYEDFFYAQLKQIYHSVPSETLFMRLILMIISLQPTFGL